MVECMEEMLSVDEQGRVVLPAHIRKAMGIRGRCKLLIRREGSRIVLEPFPQDLNRSVEEWANLARTIRAEIFSETVEDSWKWMSLEYARRKLGLP
jgi:AbrB family looped-hinge helix DNA binding protein